LPALAVGILTRIYRLHARVSDWLGIRECFDIDVVIAELTSQLAIEVDSISRAELAAYRHTIMRKAFYSFVSGPRPQVDLQLVHQALDAWSWFWIGVEATFVFVVTGLLLLAGGEYEAGLQTVGGALLFAALGMPAMRRQCRRYAIAQVRAIVENPVRAAAAKTAFSELVGERVRGRLAA
jgi:hypothetical protein